MKRHEQKFDRTLDQIQEGLNISADAQDRLHEADSQNQLIGRLRKVGSTVINYYDAYESWLVDAVDGYDLVKAKPEPGAKTRLTIGQINDHTAKGESVVIFPFK